jgi:hypothetical protein
MSQNPKLVGTNIIDCIPQTGQCPNGCDQCYYNDPRFYRTKDEPLIPSLEEAEGKIVRVNSGHDSNIDRELVIEKTAQYGEKFYNTSIPRFDFPGPVVFTCNGQGNDRWFIAVSHPDDIERLMYVRVRACTWNLPLVQRVIDHYKTYGVMVVVTTMRYRTQNAIPEHHRQWYESKRSVINQWFCLNKEGWEKISKLVEDNVVRTCGSYQSSLCKDCGNCEWYFKAWRKAIDG